MIEVLPPQKDQKGSIMTQRAGKKSTDGNDYTFIANQEEILTAAKASSIGSTDKRSQVSSDSARKPIRMPTMTKKDSY